jgi:hypothetical protein
MMSWPSISRSPYVERLIAMLLPIHFGRGASMWNKARRNENSDSHADAYLADGTPFSFGAQFASWVT